MIQRHFIALTITLTCLQAGCKPTLIKEGTKAIQKVRAFSSKATSARPASNGVTQQLSRNADDAGQFAVHSTHLLTRSKSLGEQLVALQAKMHATAYNSLYQRWQQNEAELNSFNRQLEEPNLEPGRRDRLLQKLDEAVTEQAEIERLVEQYG